MTATETPHLAADLQVGHYVWRPETDELEWSPSVLGLYGVDQPPSGGQAWLQRLHPDDRAGVEAEVSIYLQGDTRRFSRTYRVIRPDGEVRTMLDRGIIERDEAGSATAFRGLTVDVTCDAASLSASEAGTSKGESRYRTLFEAIDEGFCIAEIRFRADDGLTDYRVVEANAAFYERTGFPRDILGRWLREAAPALEEHWYDIYGGVARSRAPTRFEQNSEMLGRWFDVYAFPIDRPEDCRVAILFNDISERKRQEELTQYLTRELSHRSKNLLTLVQAIARQTDAQGKEGFFDRFSARLAALASAQNVLVENREAHVPIAELVESQLAHFSSLMDDRIMISGPALVLKPDVVQIFGMVAYELATNAVKYGALSNATGRVQIRWSVEDAPESESRLHVTWQEEGGPSVQKPDENGFGSIVATRLVKSATRGAVSMDFAPDGLVWRLSCPTDHVLAQPDA
jgi:two-component sensor histidine kinase/PAS domain-containing protein